MGLNYKPFNAGVWCEEKEEMLAYLKRMLPGESRNPYFRHYASLLACDLSNVAAQSTGNDYEELSFVHRPACAQHRSAHRDDSKHTQMDDVTKNSNVSAPRLLGVGPSRWG